MKTLSTLGTVALGLSLAAPAFAQDEEAAPAASEAEAPAAGGEAGGPPPITGVRAGGLAIWGSIGVNMSKSAVAKPFSVTPDIYYGVNDDLSIGLVHSRYAMTGFASYGGEALCLAGKEKGCAKVFDNTGVVAKYKLAPDLALDVGLLIPHISDPMFAGLKIGVSGRLMAGPLMVMYEPNLYVGATKRDVGNKESINVPVCLMLPVGTAQVGAQVGIRGPTSHFGDLYQVPVGVLAMANLNPNLVAGAAFTFENLAGKNSSADVRSLGLFVGWNN